MKSRSRVKDQTFGFYLLIPDIQIGLITDDETQSKNVARRNKIMRGTGESEVPRTSSYLGQCSTLLEMCNYLLSNLKAYHHYFKIILLRFMRLG